MKKGFTIVEVSILFVIFLIVAFLVAPLSLDDTIQAKNTSRWRNVQGDDAAGPGLWEGEARPGTGAGWESHPGAGNDVSRGERGRQLCITDLSAQRGW